MLLRHRHETAVLVARVLDRCVDDASIVIDRFGLPTKEPAIGLSRRLGVAGLELVPAHTANVVFPLRCATAPPRRRASRRRGRRARPRGRIHLCRTAPRVPGAQSLRSCDGLFGACDRDVIVPVRWVLVLLVDGTHCVAVGHRVDSARDLIVPELPAKQITVEGLRASASVVARSTQQNVPDS